MISEEQKSLIKKLYDDYSSQMKTIDDKDGDSENLYDIILDNFSLCCRLNAITEILDILELDYRFEGGKIEFNS